jgi:hypothetical protein
METIHNREGQLRTMSLIATLRTAAEVCQAIALRRAGVDPSEQEEAAAARAHLHEADERLRLEVGLEARRDPAGPRDGRLGIGERRRIR